MNEPVKAPLDTRIFQGRKVLQLIGDSNFGGDTIYLFALADRMRQYGGRTWVGTTAPETIRLAQEKDHPVALVPSLHRPINPLADVRAVAQVFRICRKHRFDMIHTHTSKPGVVGRIAARLAGVTAVVHTTHGFPFHSYSHGLEKLLYPSLEWLAGLFCDLVIAVKEEDRQLALKKRILPPEKIATVINGIDPKRFEGPYDRAAFRRSIGVGDEQILVGYIGRMADQKDPKTFIDAAGLLARDRPRVRCMFVGDGPLFEEMKSYAAGLGLGDHLLLPGFRRNIADYFRALDIFVLSSLWEGLPYALLEAMCLRLPIVATNIPGNLACTDESCALLVNPQKPDQIRDAVLFLVDHPEVAREKAAHAHRRFVEDFTEEKMVDHIFGLYEQVFRRRERREAP